jgi:hypothetical protein
MASRKKSRLRVQQEGTRRFINVPADRARDLHAYLRGHGVVSAPPEPAFTGIDNIELARDIDIRGVQTLLNNWSL